MRKTIEYSTTRVLDATQIEDDFYAMQEKVLIDGKEIKCTEGIISKEAFNKVKEHEPIKLSKFGLYREDILEFSRNNLIFQDYSNINKFYIDKPYTHIRDKGIINCVLLNVSTKDSSIYSIEGKKYPKAIHFDYIQANVHNGYYDLNKALEILKKREDIYFTEERILNIPYYNVSEEYGQYLKFIWKPSDTDFGRISDLKSFEMYDYIVANIFGIQKKWDK